MKKIITKTLSFILILAMLAAASGCGGARKAYSEAQAYPAPAASAAPAAAPADMARDSKAGGGMLVSGFTAPNSANMEVLKEEMLSDEADYEDMPEPDGGGVAGPTAKPVIDARKIIKNMDLQLQTLAFDAGVESIPQMAESFGGYVQDSYVEGRDMYNERGMRRASFTIRIPAEKLDSFVSSVGNEFHVISKSQNSQDITDSYYDSKARLDALKIQEERLLEMLKQAAELEYLLQVEKELMNVRYEIESLTSSLNRMDSYVSMSTVTISLSEVVKYVPVEDVPVTFWERISRAFGESWKSFGEFSQNFAVGFVAAFPFLLLLAAIAAVIILFIRRGIKRGKDKKAANTDARTTPVSTKYAPAGPAQAEQEQAVAVEEDKE